MPGPGGPGGCGSSFDNIEDFDKFYRRVTKELFEVKVSKRECSGSGSGSGSVPSKRSKNNPGNPIKPN